MPSSYVFGIHVRHRAFNENVLVLLLYGVLVKSLVQWLHTDFQCDVTAIWVHVMFLAH